MPFTVQELENIANQTLDFHLKGQAKSQTLQNKPLLRELRKPSNRKTFPGGKEFITRRVKGDYTTTIQGYQGDDSVTYANPANVKQAYVPWKEIHAGISVTLSELKANGISIVDSANGSGERMHSDREMVALSNLFQDKLEDMTEGFDRGMNLMLWRDGTQDSKEVPGIRSFIVNSPSSAAIVGGLDQSALSWWRNRASLNINAGTPANQNLVNTLQAEFRQLRRYGNPRHVFLCGSDFLTAFEKELKALGNYTMTGWAQSGRIDASVADLAFKGVNLEYDPTLDDEGLAKYGFVIDMGAVNLMPMDGEDMKKHTPARPENKYVLYRAVTWTGGLAYDQRNTSGVYSIA